MKMTRAYELLAKLNILTLVGQDAEGQLEWIGTIEQLEQVDKEMETILEEWEVKRYGFDLEEINKHEDSGVIKNTLNHE